MQVITESPRLHYAKLPDPHTPARNLLGLNVLAEEKGVSHMHFDHMSDEDLIGSDSAGLIVGIKAKPM